MATKNKKSTKSTVSDKSMFAHIETLCLTKTQWETWENSTKLQIKPGEFIIRLVGANRIPKLYTNSKSTPATLAQLSAVAEITSEVSEDGSITILYQYGEKIAEISAKAQADDNLIVETLIASDYIQVGDQKITQASLNEQAELNTQVKDLLEKISGEWDDNGGY